MTFDLQKSIEILGRTPYVLEVLLSGLSGDWIYSNEGENTWSPYDVVGHLIHGEQTDWIPRVEIILSEASDKKFIPFNRFAQLDAVEQKTLGQLLNEFKILRGQSISVLKSKHITADDLAKTGIHPEFGEVTLEQLLATWTAHDLGHIVQIARTMAKQYTVEVGPWTKYLSVFTR